MKCFNLPLIFVLLFVGYNKADNLPSFITPCKRNDPNLSECIETVTNLLKPKLKEDIPELGLKSVEPLLLKEALINVGNEKAPLHLNIVIKDAKIHGISNFDIKDINIDFNQNVLKLSTNAPLITIDGDLTANGRVLLLQVNGKSKFRMDLDNSTTNAKFTAEKITKNGEDYYKITDNVVETDVKKVKLEILDDLLDGNHQISEELNKVITENTDILYKDIEPVIKEIWSNLCVKYINIVFNKFSINELFPLE